VKAAQVKAGVVGRPITHSLSPLIHGAWLKAAGMEGEYRAYSPEEGQSFDAFAYGLRAEGLAGVNVTLPFKEAALALADRASHRAAAAGAANLLLFRPEGIEADNTDGVGLMSALDAAGYVPQSGPAVVLGAGGAARGAFTALIAAGAPEVRVVNRTASRAEVLAELHAGARAFAWTGMAEALDGAAVVVNATSLGMTGQPPLAIDFSNLPPGAVIYDAVYAPLVTPLLAEAERRGHPTIDGLSMLIGQGRLAFELFFGVPAPSDPASDAELRARLTA
jgi:shikimate dehydrogenase